MLLFYSIHSFWQLNFFDKFIIKNLIIKKSFEFKSSISLIIIGGTRHFRFMHLKFIIWFLNYKILCIQRTLRPYENIIGLISTFIVLKYCFSKLFLYSCNIFNQYTFGLIRIMTCIDKTLKHHNKLLNLNYNIEHILLSNFMY